MINSEKDLEDYICENQEDFIKALQDGFNAYRNEIKFIGRQVKIGENNIADLMYYYDDTFYNSTKKEDGEIEKKMVAVNRSFIIVELKYREIEPKDLSQLRRYINTLRDKILSDKKYSEGFNEVYVLGAFVSFGENELMKTALMGLEDQIISIKIKPQFYFEKESYSYTDDYINNINLDERIEKIYE